MKTAKLTKTDRKELTQVGHDIMESRWVDTDLPMDADDIRAEDMEWIEEIVEERDYDLGQALELVKVGMSKYRPMACPLTGRVERFPAD